MHVLSLRPVGQHPNRNTRLHTTSPSSQYGTGEITVGYISLCGVHEGMCPPPPMYLRGMLGVCPCLLGWVVTVLMVLVLLVG